MLFFIYLWVPGCSLMAPKPCKNAGALASYKQKITLQMQVKCIFPKTPPELGSRLVFWKRGLGAFSFLEKGAWSDIGRSGSLVYAKRSF